MGRVRKQHNSKELSGLVKNVAFKVKAFRERAGLSQNELSRQSGVATSTINEIENHRVSDLRLSTLCQLSKTLKKQPMELMGGSDFEITDADKREFDKAFAILAGIHQRIK